MANHDAATDDLEGVAAPPMSASEAADFYTGLVADLYSPLKSTSFDPSRYADLIDRYGEPALELGCGDGDPLIDLRARGYGVDGLDASPDVINRLHRRAGERGVKVNALVSTMQTMMTPRRYRTIFLAGPTFNLLPDDRAMTQALLRIRDALADGGVAIVPLFVPDPIDPETIGIPRRQDTVTGWMACRVLAVKRDERGCTQTVTLQYEREHRGELERIERDWTLHWISKGGFTIIARNAGLQVLEAPDTIGAEASEIVLAHLPR